MSFYPLLLLAGGQSARMGRPKGLLEVNGRPLILEQIEQFRAAGGKEIVFVLGFHADEYRAVLGTTKDVTIVVNEHPERGQFSSLLVGCSALLVNGRGMARHAPTFVLPVDVPAPGKDVWEKLAAAMKKEVDVCIPMYGDRGGHPVLLSARFVEKLLTIAPDHPDARLDIQIHRLDQGRIARIPVDDRRVAMNVNTPTDLASL